MPVAFKELIPEVMNNKGEHQGSGMWKRAFVALQYLQWLAWLHDQQLPPPGASHMLMIAAERPPLLNLTCKHQLARA